MVGGAYRLIVILFNRNVLDEPKVIVIYKVIVISSDFLHYKIKRRKYEF